MIYFRSSKRGTYVGTKEGRKQVSGWMNKGYRECGVACLRNYKKASRVRDQKVKERRER